MPDTPLNPDAILEAARASRHALQDEDFWGFSSESDAQDYGFEEGAKWAQKQLAVAQPEVNSVEELEALPINSLVLDRFDYPHHKCAQSKPDFTNLRTGHFISRGEFYFPARVLYRPEVKP